MDNTQKLVELKEFCVNNQIVFYSKIDGNQLQLYLFDNTPCLKCNHQYAKYVFRNSYLKFWNYVEKNNLQEVVTNSIYRDYYKHAMQVYKEEVEAYIDDEMIFSEDVNDILEGTTITPNEYEIYEDLQGLITGIPMSLELAVKKYHLTKVKLYNINQKVKRELLKKQKGSSK